MRTREMHVVQENVSRTGIILQLLELMQQGLAMCIPNFGETIQIKLNT